MRVDFQLISLRLFGLSFIFLLWALISSLRAVNPLFLPSPPDTLSALSTLLFEKGILSDFLISLSRVLAGFLLAVILGIPFGFALSLFPMFGKTFGGSVDLLRYVPAVAYIPLSIVWLGIGDAQKVFIILAGTIPFIVLYTARAVASVEKKHLDTAHALGLSKLQTVSRVVFPSVSPELFDICRIELGGAWALVIVAELVAATSGIGHRLVLSQRFLQTEFLFAEILLIALIGFCFDFGLRAWFAHLFPWTDKARRGLGGTA